MSWVLRSGFWRPNEMAAAYGTATLVGGLSALGKLKNATTTVNDSGDTTGHVDQISRQYGNKTRSEVGPEEVRQDLEREVQPDVEVGVRTGRAAVPQPGSRERMTELRVKLAEDILRCLDGIEGEFGSSELAARSSSLSMQWLSAMTSLTSRRKTRFWPLSRQLKQLRLTSNRHNIIEM